MQVDGVPVFGKDADFVTSKIMGKIGTPIATKFRRDIMILERARERARERERARARGRARERDRHSCYHYVHARYYDIKETDRDTDRDICMYLFKCICT